MTPASECIVELSLTASPSAAAWTPDTRPVEKAGTALQATLAPVEVPDCAANGAAAASIAGAVLDAVLLDVVLVLLALFDVVLVLFEGVLLDVVLVLLELVVLVVAVFAGAVEVEVVLASTPVVLVVAPVEAVVPAVVVVLVAVADVPSAVVALASVDELGAALVVVAAEAPDPGAAAGLVELETAALVSTGATAVVLAEDAESAWADTNGDNTVEANNETDKATPERILLKRTALNR